MASSGIWGENWRTEQGLADLVHDLESLLKGEKSDSLKTPSAQQSQDGWASSPAEGKEPPQASSKINGATTTPNAQPPPLASGGSSVLQHKGSRTEQPVRGEGESPHKPAPTSRSSSRSDLGQDSEALKMDQNISTMKSTKAQQATPRQMAASTVGKSPTRHHSKSNGATAPPPVHDPQTASTQTHSRQKQQDHPRLSQKEKAKGVLEIVDSTPSSPTFTSKLPKSMQYRRDSGTRFEMGESSTQALIFAGKGKWTEAKSPYWWRKERQQSRTSAEANQRTDPNRGKILFRQHAYGKCFNCFAASHQVRDCRAPTRCWRCNGDGHRAARCCRPAVRPLNPPPCPPPRSSSSTSSPSHPRTLGDNHRSYLEVARGEQPMAAYPGDPRARPAGGSVCISATGAIKRRRDALVRKAVVCSLEGNNYDSEIYHVRDAIRSQFKLGFGDFQVIKHYPEQYLVIFSDPQNWERATRQRSIIDNGRVYKFAPWDETREAVHAHLEFRVHARIEGIPPHAWGADVAEKILGKSCAIHYVEEHTRRRERTRTYDLWAWCSDPCKIPTEVWLTITDPDMEPPPVDIPLSHTTVHQDPPTDIKHGLVFRVLPHVATIEDLSFIRGNGGPGGPPNRKRHRHFDWRYGEPDSRGEVRGRQDHGHGRDGPRRHRWDDEEDGRRGHLRRHTSASAWGRVTRCRNGAADCYSSNFRGFGGSRQAGDSYRSRDYKPEEKSFFYKAKVAPLPTSNSKSTRKVSFADPLCSFFGDSKPFSTSPTSELLVDEAFFSETPGSQAIHFDPMLDEVLAVQHFSGKRVVKIGAVLPGMEAGQKARNTMVSVPLPDPRSAMRQDCISNTNSVVGERDFSVLSDRIVDLPNQQFQNLNLVPEQLTILDSPRSQVSVVHTMPNQPALQMVEHTCLNIQTEKVSEDLDTEPATPQPSSHLFSVLNSNDPMSETAAPRQGSQPHSNVNNVESVAQTLPTVPGPNGFGASEGEPIINQQCQSHTEHNTVQMNTTHPAPNSPIVPEPVISELDPMETFLQSVARPVPTPLLQLQQTPRSTQEDFHNPLACSSQRKSTRLAKKAAANPGKEVMQLAQDLLIRKLGNLATESEPEPEHEPEPDFEFYAQHFVRPLEMPKMEVLKYLIENGTKKQKRQTTQAAEVMDSAVDA